MIGRIKKKQNLGFVGSNILLQRNYLTELTSTELLRHVILKGSYLTMVHIVMRDP